MLVFITHPVSISHTPQYLLVVGVASQGPLQGLPHVVLLPLLHAVVGVDLMVLVQVEGEGVLVVRLVGVWVVHWYLYGCGWVMRMFCVALVRMCLHDTSTTMHK